MPNQPARVETTENTSSAAGSHRTVQVTKPGSAIKVERIVLTPSSKKGLSTGVEWLEAPAKK